MIKKKLFRAEQFQPTFAQTLYILWQSHYCVPLLKIDLSLYKTVTVMSQYYWGARKHHFFGCFTVLAAQNGHCFKFNDIAVILKRFQTLTISHTSFPGGFTVWRRTQAESDSWACMGSSDHGSLTYGMSANCIFNSHKWVGRLMLIHMAWPNTRQKSLNFSSKFGQPMDGVRMNHSKESQ